MTVGNIIKAVRWCIDEEALNVAGIADVSAYDFDDGTHTDMGLMNNIIRYKIPAALRWVCLYAPAEQLSGVASGGSGGGGGSSSTIDIIQEDASLSTSSNLLTPSKTLIRVIRVKGTGWHRAILGDTLIKEDSDEYLAVNDTNGAQATKDRPQAALVNTKTKKVEVFPAESGDTFSLTYITTISASDLQNLNDDSTEVGIPAQVETSFIYYLAYLLCSAYGDARAKSMFDIATLNLGKSEDKQRQ
jgi:hypothetical protein